MSISATHNTPLTNGNPNASKDGQGTSALDQLEKKDPALALALRHLDATEKKKIERILQELAVLIASGGSAKIENGKIVFTDPNSTQQPKVQHPNASSATLPNRTINNIMQKGI